MKLKNGMEWNQKLFCTYADLFVDYVSEQKQKE